MRRAICALLLLPPSATGFTGPLARTISCRASHLRSCAAEDVRENLEAKLKEAVAQEDYKAAAELKAQLDVAPVNVEKMYASLHKRTSQLTSRRDAVVKEREILKDLAGIWPKYEVAQRSLWDHWFREYGDAAYERLLAADGKASELVSIIDDYPDWVEPANRLATLRFLEGDFDESVELCLKILRQKPWHFGASSGIVMCYAKLGDAQQANEWAKQAMPQPGAERERWVSRMVEEIDARIVELDDIDGAASQ